MPASTYQQYVVHGWVSPGTPGTAPTMNAYPLPWATTLPQIAGVLNMDIPVVLQTSVVEGVDTPFLDGWGLGADDTKDRRAARLKAWQFHAGRADDFQGTQVTLLLPSPIANFTVMPSMLDYPGDRWALARKKAIWRAGEASWEARSTFPDLIPATTYSDTICRLLSEIQRHLLETPDGGVTWSPLFSADEVLRLLNERLSRFLLETGILRKRSQISVLSGTTTVDLPSDLIEVRRAAWDGGATVSGLTRMDPFGMDAGVPGWESGSGTPYAYIEEPLPALVVRLVQTPSASGVIDLIYVYDPATLTGSCALTLPLPAMWVPYLKYGVLADIFGKEGEAQDRQRAEYCESRFSEGVELARLLLGAKS